MSLWVDVAIAAIALDALFYGLVWGVGFVRASTETS